MARKRKIARKTNDEWKREIKECLTSGGNSFKWGCLNKDGHLFKISTLIRVKVPEYIINELIEDGKLFIKGNASRYSYAAHTGRTRRKIR